MDSAAPGSTIVIPPGIYHESVLISTDRLVLRARPGAVLDGTGQSGADGIRVIAPPGRRLSGFELNGLTVRNFSRNGIFLRGVDGYRITGTITRDDREYGIFPVQTSMGRIDHTSSSGSLDTGLYIGQSTDVELDHNVTFGNTIGIDVEVSDRVQVHHNAATGNAIGAIAQVIPGLSRASTQGTIFEQNDFTGNNAANPSTDPNDLLTQLPNGLGLLLVATDGTIVKNNVITGNHTAGLAAVQLPPAIAAVDPRIDPFPRNLRVVGNVVLGNAGHPDPKTAAPPADIVWDTSGSANCWTGNRFVSSVPTALPDC